MTPQHALKDYRNMVKNGLIKNTGPTAKDVIKMIEDGRLVNLGDNAWRLLSLGPTRQDHHLVEVERNIWKQVHKSDQKFLIRLASDRLEQIYPNVWKLL
jgi:hypothetical protein